MTMWHRSWCRVCFGVVVTCIVATAWSCLSCLQNDVPSPPTDETSSNEKEVPVRESAREPTVAASQPPQEVLAITFADLDLKTRLDIDPTKPPIDIGARIPAEIARLAGQRVRIAGYMLPTFEEEGIQQFILDRQSRIMNFGAPFRIDELIQVELKASTTTKSIPVTRGIDVTGTFRIEPVAEGDEIWALYFIENADVSERP
jgi:hypothetical protein